MHADPFDQHGFDIRLGWGERCLPTICAGASSTVVVDVLSFTTAVDIAASRGAAVHPLPWSDERAAREAESLGAVLAGGRNQAAWSLSPSSLLGIPAGTKLALPSPNGAVVTATAATHSAEVLAGCLRNRSAVASAAGAIAGRMPVAVVAAGERWPDGQLRVAVEDLLGAGAIVAALLEERSERRPSPEAAAAAAAYRAMAPELGSALAGCASGRELIARGFGGDVRLAAEADVSATVPRLRDGAYVAAAPSP